MPDTQPPSYSPGLDGVIAGESAICHVDRDAGLIYRGYDIHELAGRVTFEQVAYLLLSGELPDPPQLAAFRRDLAAQASLPAPVISMLRLLPSGVHPMDALRTGVSMLAAFDDDLNDNSHAANLRKSLRLIARVSTLATTGWQISQGKDPIAPPPDSTHAGRFLRSLTARKIEPWQTDALDLVLVLYAEHEFNASTFSARVTASTLADIYAAVTAALATLKGPLHGGANEQVIPMLQQIGAPDRAHAWANARLAAHEKIMGFGHRVYKHGDSRVPAMRTLAADLARRAGQSALYEICAELERVMESEKGLYANLDLSGGLVLKLLDVPVPLNTPVFAASRVAGWCAHVIEQHDHNRLIRPRSLYTGPPPRHLTS